MLPYSENSRYLVSNEQSLFEATPASYVRCSVEDALIELNKMPIISLDAETKGLDPHTKPLLLIQLGNYDKQFAIDATSVNLALFKDLLENPKKLFILHNAKFDIKFLFHQKIILRNVFDTMLAEKLIWLGYPAGMHPASLDYCCAHYLNIKLDKSVRGKIINSGLTEEVIVYGCNDVKYLERLMVEQIKVLKQKGLERAAQAENYFVPLLAYIEYCGIKLDQVKWLDKMHNDVIKLNTAKKTLDEWVINYGKDKYLSKGMANSLFEEYRVPLCKINWNAPAQVIPLFEELGFNLWTKDKKTGKMKKSVEGKIIEKQAHLSSIVAPYLEYQKWAKIVSTYGQSILNSVNKATHRIHTNFTQLMDTTRLSCGGKDRKTGEEYVNLQNLPSDEETRSCFIPEEGNLLIDCDYTAQEDLVFTELSRDPKLIDFYNSPDERDGHSFVAKLCFPEELADVPERDVKAKFPKIRKISKGGKFCLHYGGTPFAAADNLNIPVKVAEDFYTRYLQVFSGIKSYLAQAFKKAWSQGYVLIHPITGHKAYIYDWDVLKGIEKRLTSEFWNEYRLYKGQMIQPGLVKEELKWIVNKFGEGWSIQDIIEKFTIIEYPSDSKKQTAIDKERGGILLNNETFRLDERTIYLHVVSHFFRRKGDCQRMAYNYSTQGTAAQITKYAGVLYWRSLIERDLVFTVKIVNDVHDEYVVECPAEIAEREASILSQCMEKAASLFVTVVKLKAVPEIGDHWIH